jgi:serine/threonine protein phosphatase PrpC
MEHHIYSDTHMDAPEFIPVAQGQVGVFSARSPDPAHTANEDTAAVFAVDDRRAVIALADGVGGIRGGELASGIAIQQLQLAIGNGVLEQDSLRTSILDAFENANRKVVETGLGAATTFAVVEIDAGRIRPYHAGDSEILAVGLRGKLKLHTVVHSPVGYAVESGVMDEREAMEHDERHIVSNVIGDPEMRIEVGPTLSLARRDTVIVASDGLTDNFHTDEIIEMIRKNPLPSVMKQLAAETKRRMIDRAGPHPSKPDDVTFLLYRRTD